MPLCYRCNTTWNSCSCHHESFRVDGQFLRDHTIKFARWQHPATGRRGVMFTVHNTTCSALTTQCVFSSLPSAMKKLNFVKCLDAKQPKITLRGEHIITSTVCSSLVALSYSTAPLSYTRRVSLSVCPSHAGNASKLLIVFIIWFSPTTRRVAQDSSIWDELLYPRSQGRWTLTLTLESPAWNYTT